MNLEIEVAKMEIEVAKMVNGLTGNEDIDSLVRECRRHAFASAVKLQEAKNKFDDCCIRDTINKFSSLSEPEAGY